MRIVKIQKKLVPKLVNGTLPDIDTDFAGRDRGAIKSYIENRFGQNQVCSVGTFTTMKIKSLIKDISRSFSIDFAKANFITSLIDIKDETILDLYKRAVKEPALKRFIKENSDLFYILPTLLGQPKAQSIHSCAMIIFPNILQAQEWCPVRRQQGLIVSDWGGGEMEDAGFLKEDILGVMELDKFTDILKLIEINNKQVPNIYDLPYDYEVYRYFGNGWNGDVFQLGTTGLTEYTKSLKPQNIEDLIAAVAVFRPGPMENHYHEIYVKCKNEGRAVKYLWGTEQITKNTYGLLIYQEQIMQVCQELGGLTMKEADEVRRAMGKKQLYILEPWKIRIKKGFLDKGCEDNVFESIWVVMLEFAKYAFNRSHSAAYAITGYISQYLKVNYPLEYWTVALKYADEIKTLTFLSEIISTDTISFKVPDINKSNIYMRSDHKNSQIFWGIGSIKGIGDETATQIIDERKKNGDYKNFEDFYDRTKFKGSKVKKTTYEALITSGAFDILHDFEGSEQNRNTLLVAYREGNNVLISNPTRDIYMNGETAEKWWWKLQQKKLTGLSFIDYKKIVEKKGIKEQFCTQFELINPQKRGIFRSFGGYIVEIKVKKSKKGEYARVTVEYNYKLFTLLVWNEEFLMRREDITESDKRLVIFTAELRYDSKYMKANQFIIKENSIFTVL